MRRLFLGLAALLALAVTVHAQQPGRAVVSYELANGLRVSLAPDPTVPKVAMYLRYRVGSMNEPPGRSGFAHLFEHLMFSGTRAWPNVFGAHLANGNDINAWTSEDGTVYYVEGVSANLPMILSLEADRMANLGGEVDQGELDLQRAVVKNEMRQNVLDQAGNAGWEAVWGALFPKSHPYSRSVIGSMADLDAATLDDVRGFFNTYYVPNNAVLALVGDFTVDEAKALVEQTFGKVARGPAVATPDAPDTAPTAVRLELEDRLPHPWVMLAHSGPRAGARENGPLALAAELMGNVEYGFLRQRLVAEKGLSTYVRAEWTPGLLGGRFTIDISGVPGVTAGTLETELKAAVAEFLAAPLDAADVERARGTLLLHNRLKIEPYSARAAEIAHAADVLGDPDAALVDDPHVANATAADIEAAARAVLDPATATVMVVMPGDRGTYPPVLVESTGEPRPFTAPDRPQADIPVLGPGEPREAEPPARAEATLSNGARLVHYLLPASPMAYVAAVGDGGWDNAAPGREGLLETAVGMAVRGAGERDYAAFAMAAKDIGASIGYRAELAGTALTLSVPGEAFAAGAALLADAVLRPRFDPAEWRQLVATRLDRIAWDETDLANIAWNAVLDAVLPATADAPSPRWLAASVEATTLEEARAAHARLFQPASTTFVSVGPLPLDAVAAGLEAAFAGWRDTEPGFPRVKRRPLTFPEGMRVLVAPEPGASQSMIEVLRPAPGLAEDHRPESIAVMRLLGGDFSSRLNTVIREEKGYSYGVSAGLLNNQETGSGFYLSAPVDREHTGAALSEIFKGFASLTGSPPTEDELTRTVTTYRTALAGAAETGSGLFATILVNDGLDVSLEEHYLRQRQVTELDLDDVRRQALALATLEPSVVVVAGDPEVILPQLAAIGVEAELLPPREASTARSGTDLVAPAGDPVGRNGGGRTGGFCAEGELCD